MHSHKIDSKAKLRAVEAGVAFGLARTIAARFPEKHTTSVRVKMLISDLLQVPDLQVGILGLHSFS